MKKILITILLLTGFKGRSCDCYESPIIKIIDCYKDIFAARIEGRKVTSIKTWKGSFPVDSTFNYKYGEHECSAYSIAKDGIYVFYMNSKEGKYCNLCDPYYYSNAKYLENNFKNTIVNNSKYKALIDSLNYENQYVIYSGEKIDIKGKKTIFIAPHRFSNVYTRLTIENFEDISRIVGFYSTGFHVIEKNYSFRNCKYDYVFLVTCDHMFIKITNRIKRRIKRKIRKACS